MTLSIIIPVYNVENFLDDCIISIFNQGLDNQDFEVILIDDGSHDSSLCVAYKWASIYKNIKVFHKENQGQAAARNLGIEIAKGEYIMFVDSDDFLYEKALYAPLKYIVENNYDCIHFGMGIEQENGNIIYPQISGIQLGHTYSGEFVALNFDMFGSVCPFIFKSNLFDLNKVRFKSGFAHEDSELCFRLFPLIKTMYFDDTIVYHYRFNHNSTDRSNNLNSIRRKYNSDLLIATELRKLIYAENLPKSLNEHYRRISNSLVVSHYLAYSKRPELFASKKKYYSFVRDLNLFPLKGRSLSLKSTLFMYILNLRYFVYYSRI